MTFDFFQNLTHHHVQYLTLSLSRTVEKKPNKFDQNNIIKKDAEDYDDNNKEIFHISYFLSIMKKPIFCFFFKYKVTNLTLSHNIGFFPQFCS